MNPVYSAHTLWAGPIGPGGELALALIAAHLAGDFVFQTDRMVAGKRRPGGLLAHAAIQGILAYAVAGQRALWAAPVLVFLTHAAIDFRKARMAPGRQAVFWADQAAHGLVIAILSVWLGPHLRAYGCWERVFGPGWWSALATACGAIVCVRAAAIVIGFWVQPYLDEIRRPGRDGFAAGVARGLTNGGRTIGQWERALIFVFMLMGQPGAVGFLIAAKTIFRFGELMDRRNRMEAEYITIGTLMSFGTAVVVSLATLLVSRSIGRGLRF